MSLKLSYDLTWNECNSRFTSFFPYLKLEAEGPHRLLEPDKLKIHKHQKSKSRKKNIPSGFLEIYPWETVSRTREKFKDAFELDVQILRKSLDTWIRSSAEDEVSLAELNEISAKEEEEHQSAWIEREKLL